MKVPLIVTLSMSFLFPTMATHQPPSVEINISMNPQIQMEEILAPKRLKDFADLGRYNSLNKFMEIDVGGEIHDLEPYIVKPRLTLEQKIAADIEENVYRFLTPKGLVEECLNDLPDWDINFLNRFTLPLFGIPPETRAARIAKRRQWQRHYQIKALIKEAQRDFYPEECVDFILVKQQK